MKRRCAVVLAALTGAAGCGPVGSALGEPADHDGEAAMRIVGGAPATVEQLFGTVSLVPPIDPFNPFCTGTLVAPDVVVTAAHCVVEHDGSQAFELAPSEVRVTEGALDPTTAGAQQRHEVAIIVAHEAYEPTATPGGIGQEDDIAVLVLADPVLTQNPIPILPLADFDARVHVGAPVVITGYGHRDAAGTDLEQAGQLYIAETPFQVRSGFEYIAGSPNSPDSCLGDSGGPGYVSVGDVLTLVGASSRAAQPGITPCGKGGISTLVPAYEPWLIEQTKGRYQPIDIDDSAGGASGDGGSAPAVGDLSVNEGDGCTLARRGPSPRRPNPLGIALTLCAGICWAARRRGRQGQPTRLRDALGDAAPRPK